MRFDDVPSEDFMRTEETYDDTTFRRPPSPNPAGELEEEITAAILRLATERFRRRQGQDGPAGEEDGGVDSDTEVPDAEPSIEGSQEQEIEKGVLKMEIEESDGSSDGGEESQQARGTAFRAAISADDELSYGILRPSVRHILTKLDRTLTTLHNTRMAAFTHMSESDPEEEDKDDGGQSSPPSRKKRKRASGNEDTDQGMPDRRKRLGRPAKVHTPREGETEREMLIRVAREKKQRIPVFSDEEDGTPTYGRPRSRRRNRDTASQPQPQPQPEDHVEEVNPSQDAQNGSAGSSSAPSAGPGSHVEDPERRLERMGLRDWRDVLGAAAMAGFSSKVIARASQRCANLFGQQIEFKTLAEYPAAHGTRRMHTTRYRPGGTISSDEEEDEEEAAMTEVEQRRAVSRSSSVAIGSSSSDDGGEKIKRPRGRRRNDVTTVGQFYCPHPGCSRAIQGFSKRSNLTRHLDTVHGKSPALEHMTSDDEDVSNEVHGAVHVDGFLKPIKVRRGWREGDTKPRPPRPRRGVTQQSRRQTPNSDDGYMAERGDDDFVKHEGEEEYI
jgi:hypothetical protein